MQTARTNPYFHTHPYQHMYGPGGMLNEDFVHPLAAAAWHGHPHYQGIVVPTSGKRGASEIESSKDKFQVKLAVTNFTPEEVFVKVTEDYLTVEGNHEDSDSHGFMSQSFKRRYHLPANIDLENIDKNVVCNLSSDGILFITVPKLKPEPVPPKDGDEPEKEKVIPITHTGLPAHHGSDGGYARNASGGYWRDM